MVVSIPRHAIPLVLVVLALPALARAQSARDAVKDHVNKNLDSKQGKRTRNASSQGRGPATRGESSQDGTPIALGFADDPELVNPRGPKLPIRLFPGISDILRLNLRFDTAYRGWLPQQYESADVDIGSYLTWSIAAKGKFFKYITLRRGSYESNGLSSPRNKSAAVAQTIGKHSPKAAKALAYVGFPFMKSWQPEIRYEARAYSTSASPRIPVCIVGYEDSADLMDCPRESRDLEMISSYETLVAGVRYLSSAPSTSMIATQKGVVPPIYMGLGLLSYRKPYQVTIDGDTLEEFLFDGRFRGAGLALGTDLGGGARRFFANVDLQVGLGSIALTRDFDLGEVAPDDWLIGYVQGNLDAGFRFVIFDGAPTIYFQPSLSLGGASFHFVNASGTSNGANDAPTLNWDLLWSTRAALEIAL